MSDCRAIQELVPWYVAGSLLPEERQRVAGHLLECEACREELAVVLNLQLASQTAFSEIERLSPEVWQRVLERTHGERTARLDLGSFLLGFTMGARVRGGRVPMRADLRVLGRKVPLFNTERGGSK